MKKNEECYCLYVNLTHTYISFKIEKGKYIGTTKKTNKYVKEWSDTFTTKIYYVIEHEDDEVNYLEKENVFKTEKDAYKELIKILQSNLKNK